MIQDINVGYYIYAHFIRIKNSGYFFPACSVYADKQLSAYTLYADTKLSAYTLYADTKLSAYTLYADKATIKLM